MVTAGKLMGHSRSQKHQQALVFLKWTATDTRVPATRHAIATQASDVDVPRAEKFVWAMTSLWGNCSWRQFGSFCQAHNLSVMLADGRVCQDMSPRINGQIIVAVAESLWREDQESFKGAVAATLAQDERAQVLCIIARWVCWEGTKLVERQRLLGVIRDFGFGAESIRQGLERVLRFFCTKRKGRRDTQARWDELGSAQAGAQRDVIPRDPATGEPGDILDTTLWATLQRVTWGAVADGAKDEVNAFRIAAHDGLLPNLVAVDWDLSHNI